MFLSDIERSAVSVQIKEVCSYLIVMTSPGRINPQSTLHFHLCKHDIEQFKRVKLNYEWLYNIIKSLCFLFFAVGQTNFSGFIFNFFKTCLIKHFYMLFTDVCLIWIKKQSGRVRVTVPELVWSWNFLFLFSFFFEVLACLVCFLITLHRKTSIVLRLVV